jgi:hypothetical protein
MLSAASWVRYECLLGAYVKFQPEGWPGCAWGGLCEVWWEGGNARGSRPHKGGFAKKKRMQEINIKLRT